MNSTPETELQRLSEYRLGRVHSSDCYTPFFLQYLNLPGQRFQLSDFDETMQKSRTKAPLRAPAGLIFELSYSMLCEDIVMKGRQKMKNP